MHAALRNARGKVLRAVNIIELITPAEWRPRVLHAVEVLFDGAPLAVRKTFPAPDAEDVVGRLTHGGLALPTWLYGHEPANLFAGQLGKYFSNAVREDSILRLSRGGIVFAPGWAGTVQEVFQAATKTFYRTDGPSGAFVFLGVEHWAALPVEALLRPLLARSPHGDQSGLLVVTDSLDEAVTALTAR